jgi:hypothetical protein
MMSPEREAEAAAGCTMFIAFKSKPFKSKPLKVSPARRPRGAGGH